MVLSRINFASSTLQWSLVPIALSAQVIWIPINALRGHCSMCWSLRNGRARPLSAHRVARACPRMEWATILPAWLGGLLARETQAFCPPLWDSRYEGIKRSHYIQIMGIFYFHILGSSGLFMDEDMVTDAAFSPRSLPSSCGLRISKSSEELRRGHPRGR